MILLLLLAFAGSLAGIFQMCIRDSLWAGGFPCQDISVAGRQRGLDGARRDVYKRQPSYRRQATTQTSPLSLT